MLLGKDKLNTIEVLISKALIDSYISHDEFVSVNNVLIEYNEIKSYVWYIKTIETFCVSGKKNTANKNASVRKTKQNRLMVLSVCAVCGKKNQLLLKIENLITFQMISLKGIKSLTRFFRLETYLYQNCI